MSVGQQLDIRIVQLHLCTFSSWRWVEVQGVKMIGFFDQQELKCQVFRDFLKLFSYLLQH